MFFNGCVQNSALRASIYIGKTGNIYQASLSYGSSKVAKKMTEKISTKNNKKTTTEEEEN